MQRKKAEKQQLAKKTSASNFSFMSKKACEMTL